MGKKINILHLDDEEYIEEMISRNLQSKNIDAKIIRVETENEYTEEIENGNHDIIIADYYLPNYNGFAALKLLNKKRLNRIW